MNQSKDENLVDRRYFRILQRWIWLFIIASIAAAASAYFISSQQPAVYTAKTRLIIGPGIDSPNPDLNALRAGGQLIQTYAELPTTGPFLRGIIEELALNTTSDRLRGKISVTSNTQTQILTIRVQAGTPAQAMDIANAMANTLVEMSPSAPGSTTAQIREQMLNQVARLQQDIAASELEIQRLQLQSRVRQVDPNYYIDVAQQRLMMDRISEERRRLSDIDRTLAMLYESLQAPLTNQVKILEPADTAELVNSQLPFKIALGGAAGLLLSILLVLAFVYLANVVDSADDLPQSANMPVLGTIAKHRRLKGAGSKGSVAFALPKSSAAEDYRVLGTKLLSPHTAGRQLRSLLLASPQQSDDSSEVAMNLGIVLAQSGCRVVLVDADLHKPSLGQRFGIEEGHTLAQLLTDPSIQPDPTSVAWAPGLFVVPGGSARSHAFALLASASMADLIAEFEKQADMVIIVGPPMLAHADSLLIAPQVGASILVVHSGKTQIDAVEKTIANLRLAGAAFVGTILCGNRYGYTPKMDPIASVVREETRSTVSSAHNGKTHEEIHQQEWLTSIASSSK